MPNFEPVIAGRPTIPNPFWGGALFPGVVFGGMYMWPALERRFTGDQRCHDLLDRPRHHPTRTAIGAAFLSWVVIIFAVGSTDRIFYRLQVSYVGQSHFWRVGIWLFPIIIIFFITRSGARALQRNDSYPMRGWQGRSLALPTVGARSLTRPTTRLSPPPSPRSVPCRATTTRKLPTRRSRSPRSEPGPGSRTSDPESCRADEAGD